MVMRVLEYAEVREEDDEYLSPLDLLFQAIERENPESVALRQYKVFKQSAGKTARASWYPPRFVWPPLTCPRFGPSQTTTIWTSIPWEKRNALSTP